MAKKQAAKLQEIIKSEEISIVSYKGFDKNWKCRDYQFKVGETFTHEGPVVACSSGFHSCENPMDVWSYYDIVSDNKFAFVKVSGQISRHADDSKIASASIVVEAELNFSEFIEAAINWLACKSTEASASGDYSQLATSGVHSKLATSGDYSQLATSGVHSQLATSGVHSQLATSGVHSKLATSGDDSQLATSGDYAQLSASGNYSKLAASGDDSQLATSGDDSQLAASGNSSRLAASGDDNKLAASGDYSQLSASGDSSQLAASGDGSKLAASGDYCRLAALGKSSIACAVSTNCSVKAGELGCIALTRWVNSEKRYRMTVGYVGENGIKPDTSYTLNESGEFVEVKT
jgi:hypothetical protein